MKTDPAGAFMITSSGCDASGFGKISCGNDPERWVPGTMRVAPLLLEKSSSSSAIRTTTKTTLASTNVVDNFQYSYRIVFDLKSDQDINNLSEASQRIYRVRVKYQ